jgi:hypothetical protein
MRRSLLGARPATGIWVALHHTSTNPKSSDVSESFLPSNICSKFEIFLKNKTTFFAFPYPSMAPRAAMNASQVEPREYELPAPVNVAKKQGPA